MKSIIKLRQQLGFCQEDMSRAIGVKRSKLVRAETCRGDLPTSAHHEIRKLRDNLEMVANMDDLEIKGHDRVSMLKEYRRQKEDCSMMIYKQRRDLKRLEEAFLAVQNGLKMLGIMEASGQSYPETWLATCRQKLEEKLSRCSPLVRSRIRIRIEGLEAEVRFIDEEIRNLEVAAETPAQQIEVSTIEVTEQVPQPVDEREVPGLFIIPYADQRHKQLTTESFSERNLLENHPAGPVPYIPGIMLSVNKDIDKSSPGRITIGGG